MNNDHTPATTAPGPAPAKSLEEVWLRRMAEAEDEGTVSVGGLVCDIEAMSNSDMGPVPGPRGDVEQAFLKWDNQEWTAEEQRHIGEGLYDISVQSGRERELAFKAGAEWARSPAVQGVVEALERAVAIFDEMDDVVWNEDSDWTRSSYEEVADACRDALERVEGKGTSRRYTKPDGSIVIGHVSPGTDGFPEVTLYNTEEAPDAWAEARKLLDQLSFGSIAKCKASQELTAGAIARARHEEADVWRTVAVNKEVEIDGLREIIQKVNMELAECRAEMVALLQLLDKYPDAYYVGRQMRLNLKEKYCAGAMQRATAASSSEEGQ